MKLNNLFFIVGLVLTLSLKSVAYADPHCTQGPECDAIQKVVTEIKSEKIKRHHDVMAGGRKSLLVKQDDEELKRLQKEDHDLRAERKSELEKDPLNKNPQKSRVFNAHQRSKRPTRSPHRSNI